MNVSSRHTAPDRKTDGLAPAASRLWTVAAVLFLLVPAWTPSSRAEEILKNSEFGVDIPLLKGWSAESTPEGYVLASSKLSGVLVIVFVEDTTLDDLQFEAEEGLEDPAQGMFLDLAGRTERFGVRAIRARFEGTVQGQPAKAVSISRVSPDAQLAVSFLMLVSAEAYSDEHMAAVEALASGVRFRARGAADEVDPDAPSGAPADPGERAGER